jgi:hypothetical protein
MYRAQSAALTLVFGAVDRQFQLFDSCIFWIGELSFPADSAD